MFKILNILKNIFKLKEKSNIIDIQIYNLGVLNCISCGEIENSLVELNLNNKTQIFYSETHNDEKKLLDLQYKNINKFYIPKFIYSVENDLNVIKFDSFEISNKFEWKNGVNKVFELMYNILKMLSEAKIINIKDISIKYKSSDEHCKVCNTYYHYDIYFFYKNNLVFNTKHNGLSIENKLPFLIGSGNDGSLFSEDNLNNTVKLLIFEFLKCNKMINISYYKINNTNNIYFNNQSKLNLTDCDNKKSKSKNKEMIKLIKYVLKNKTQYLIEDFSHLLRTQEQDCCIYLGKDKSFIIAQKIYNKYLTKNNKLDNLMDKNNFKFYEIYNNQLITITVQEDILYFSDLKNLNYNFFKVDKKNDKMKNIKGIEEILFERYNKLFYFK